MPGVAQACVSAGNTGALMATARFVLKTLPHIDRPAIITALPSIGGRTWVLDLGANVDCTAEHLLQFAVMGAELVSAVDDVASPRVGLLNIGQEEIKGNEQVKGAHELLSHSALNYAGYVEGDDAVLAAGPPAGARHGLRVDRLRDRPLRPRLDVPPDGRRPTGIGRERRTGCRADVCARRSGAAARGVPRCRQLPGHLDVAAAPPTGAQRPCRHAHLGLGAAGDRADARAWRLGTQPFPQTCAKMWRVDRNGSREGRLRFVAPLKSDQLPAGGIPDTP